MKNKNYKINLNPKDLSSQEINKHKDFEALLQQVGATPPAKKPSGIKVLYYLAGSIAAALLIGFLYIGLFADQSGNTQEYLASQSYVNPPFENIKPTYEKAVINVNQGGEYVYESGSKITVPPAAFVDNNGELVNPEMWILNTANFMILLISFCREYQWNMIAQGLIILLNLLVWLKYLLSKMEFV